MFFFIFFLIFFILFDSRSLVWSYGSVTWLRKVSLLTFFFFVCFSIFSNKSNFFFDSRSLVRSYGRHTGYRRWAFLLFYMFTSLIWFFLPFFLSGLRFGHTDVARATEGELFFFFTFYIFNLIFPTFFFFLVSIRSYGRRTGYKR